MTKMRTTLMLLLGMLASTSIAAAATNSVVTKKATRAPAVVEEATVVDDSINAKLVVDPIASTASAGAEAVTSTPEAVMLGSAPAGDMIAKPELAKLPENEIPVLRGTKEAKKTTSEGFSRILATLGVVVVALGAALFMLKRWASQKTKTRQNTKIQILTQHPLGPKKSLAIVQVAGESILIGVTDQNISMLKTLSLIDDEIPEDVPRNFNSALEDFEEETGPVRLTGKKREDDFAMRGLSEIRDTVSSRLKNKNF